MRPSGAVVARETPHTVTQHLCCGKRSAVHARLLSVPGRKSTPHVPLSEERSKAIGERLRQARHAARITQEALAQASGVGAEHIQRIERGVANPTVATLYAICDALRIPARALLPD